MGFHEVQFPTDISYGSAGGPGFATAIIETDAGHEERIARWNSPRRRYNVAYGVKSKGDLSALIDFYIARRGAENGFRFKDWTDFTSASDHTSAVDDGDQTIGTGDASETDFQLVKVYTSGPTSRTRTITKPVSGTVVVAVDGVAKTEGVDFSVDTTTGLVTFGAAPAAAAVVTAGFQFDVPVRFGIETDTALSASLDAYDVRSIPDIVLVEVLETATIADEYWFGGGSTFSTAANFQLAVADGRAISLEFTAASKTVKLPATTGLVAGGPWFYISNTGSYAFDVDDDDDVNVTTVNPGVTAQFILDDSLDWYAL